MTSLTSLEVCAGAGGQANGLEAAGFRHVALVEIDAHACRTLKTNRPSWPVVRSDVRRFDATRCEGVDLLSGGVPCPPFSVAGKQLGAEDERDLFPEMIRLAEECRPRAVLIENVPGLIKSRFDEYRMNVASAFARLGYVVPGWHLLNASDFGVPQLRPRVTFVALQADVAEGFRWPRAYLAPPPTVGEALHKEMASRGWEGADRWRDRANSIAPTLVGGSLKHGGPDLGPTRARAAWAKLGVDGGKLDEDPPEPGFRGMPRLTVKMCGLLQGFPRTWQFPGRKTPAYRQVGNAFPPPVARALGLEIARALGVAVGEDAA